MCFSFHTPSPRVGAHGSSKLCLPPSCTRNYRSSCAGISVTGHGGMGWSLGEAGVEMGAGTAMLGLTRPQGGCWCGLPGLMVATEE